MNVVTLFSPHSVTSGNQMASEWPQFLSTILSMKFINLSVCSMLHLMLQQKENSICLEQIKQMILKSSVIISLFLYILKFKHAKIRMISMQLNLIIQTFTKNLNLLIISRVIWKIFHFYSFFSTDEKTEKGLVSKWWVRSATIILQVSPLLWSWALLLNPVLIL